MVKAQITIATVNWYSSRCIADLFASVDQTAATSDLHFLVCDNTSGEDRDLYKALGDSCEIIEHQPIVPAVRHRKRSLGSYAHGLALNLLLSVVQTEYCLFVDPDCLILTRDWDIVCRSAVDGPGIAAIGAPYHARKVPKYHTFPSPIFTFFRPELFRRLEADWTPYLLPFSTHVRDQFLRVLAILAGRIGERLRGPAFHASRAAALLRALLGNTSKDTGWRIPRKIAAAGMSSVLFSPAVVPDQLDKNCVVVPALRELLEQFEVYLWQGLPILTHYYRTGHQADENAGSSYRRWRQLAMDVTKECLSEIELHREVS